MRRIKILIAGIAGASLGTEILKCLKLLDYYDIYGCDISNLAYGLFDEGFIKTFCIDRAYYIEQMLDICKRNKINVVIPGAEEPTLLLSINRGIFKDEGVFVASNKEEVIDICSNKIHCFEILKEIGIRIPLSANAENFGEIFHNDIPVVIKPSSGSGGSTSVFLAKNKEEAKLYIEYLLRNKQQPIIQEYIPHDEGEFTVGVLSLGNKIVSIALKRIFNNKLSVLYKSENGLISTGYSQGLIEDFYDIRRTCEKIAKEIGSEGPLNVQGRLKDGIFIPFEINPRFSASTYLRSMAGFNEIDLYVRSLLGEKVTIPTELKYGYYLRSLTEQYINTENLK